MLLVQFVRTMTLKKWDVGPDTCFRSSALNLQAFGLASKCFFSGNRCCLLYTKESLHINP